MSKIPDEEETLKSYLFIPTRPLNETLKNKNNNDDIELVNNGKKIICQQLAVIPYDSWEYGILQYNGLMLFFRVVDNKYLMIECNRGIRAGVEKKYYDLQNDSYGYRKRFGSTPFRVLPEDYRGAHYHFGWEINGLNNQAEDDYYNEISEFNAYNLLTGELVKGNLQGIVKASSEDAYKKFIFLFPYYEKEDMFFYYDKDEKNKWNVSNCENLFNYFNSDDPFDKENEGTISMERPNKTYELDIIFACKYNGGMFCILRPLELRHLFVVYRVLKDETTGKYQLCYPSNEETNIIKQAYNDDNECLKHNIEIIKKIEV